MLHRLTRALALACLLAAPAVSRAGEEAADASVVAIGGDVTETIYALGLEAKLVAVDSTSVFPAAALASKQNVGYMRQLSTEGVLSMRPALIIASGRAGPPEVVKALKASGARYVEIGDDLHAEGVANKARAVAAALGERGRGEKLAVDIEAKFAALAQRRASIIQPLRALFVLGVQNGRATIGGRGASADAILKLAGLVNAAGEVNGYKPATDESLIAMAPDLIVAMSGAGPGHGDPAAEIAALRGAKATPAVRDGRIVVMDGMSLLGFGPRTAEVAAALMAAAYPETGARR